jgi:hypothetical protein
MGAGTVRKLLLMAGLVVALLFALCCGPQPGSLYLI